MAAYVKIVPQKDWDVLKKYIRPGFEGMVLIPEERMEQFSDEQKEKASRLNGRFLLDYDFGGEADYWIDIPSAENNTYCMETLFGDDE